VVIQEAQEVSGVNKLHALVDWRIGFGCFWGEVQTAIHKALGCRGLVTDGGVRDLDAVAPAIQVCGKVTAFHAWVHEIAVGGTVDAFGARTT
jgi:Aldolase/RraA